MATFVADEQGKAWIEVQQGETTMRFAINGMDGVPFAPGAEIEIPDERIAWAVEQLGAGFGISDGYRFAYDPHGGDPARHDDQG